MQTIKIILAESGRVANLKKDFPLYAGAYQNKLLNVFVPKSITAPKFTSHYIDSNGVIKTDNGAYTAIKVGMTYLQRNGVIKESNTYFMRYLKDVVVNNIEYSLYERLLPKEFTLFEGQGENAPKLIVNVVNVLVASQPLDYDDSYSTITTTLDVITSQYASIDVMYSADLDNEPSVDPTDMELITSQINGLQENILNKTDKKESILTYNIDDDLPINIVYNKNGFKSNNVIFRNEKFSLKTTINGNIEECLGAVFVTNTNITNSNIYQREVFFYDKGIVERVITLNPTSLQPTDVSDWETKVSSVQEVSDAGKFLYVDESGNVNLTSAIKDFIVRQNGTTVTDKASALNFYDDFDVVAETKLAADQNLENVNIRLAPEFKQRVSNLETDNTTNKANIRTNQTKLNEKVGMSLSVSVNTSNYVMTVSLLNENKKVISSGTVDLPLETMVIDGSYANKILTLTLKNGQKINVDISSLISGLVPENRTINGKSLAANITLTASDVSAYTKTETNNLLNKKANDADLSTVAKTGKYADLDGLPIIPEGVEVVDNLTSTSAVASLSANQGRLLNTNKLDKTANAVSATKATQDSDGKTIKNTYTKLDGTNDYVTLAEPSNNGNVGGWRLVSTCTIAKWSYAHLSLAIKSRHSGTGLLVVGICDTNGTVETVDASIRFYGSTDSTMPEDAWKLIYNTSTGEARLYWKFTDYNACSIKVLGINKFSLPSNSGTWLSTTPTAGSNEIEYLPLINAAVNDGNGSVIADTYLKRSGGTVSGTLVLSKTQDANASTNNSPALIVGGTASQNHLELDGNEIMAKTDATSTGALYINTNGGDIGLSNVATVDSTNKQIVPNTDAANSLGSSSKRWKNIILSGNVNAATGTFSGALTMAGITSSASINVKKPNANWSQFVARSSSDYYRAFEADDSRIRLDVRDTTGTDNRRYIDIYSGSAKTDNAEAIVITRVNATDGNTTDIVATQKWVQEDVLLWTGNLYAEGSYADLKQSIKNFRYIMFHLFDGTPEHVCQIINVADLSYYGYADPPRFMLEMHNPNDFKYIIVKFTSETRVQVNNSSGGNVKIWHIRGLK